MAKKKKKGALPKRIAGVKIPKTVRKGPIGQFLTSDLGRAIVAETIVLAGAGLAKTQADGESMVRQLAGKSKRGLEKAGRKGSDASDQATLIVSALAGALGEAAKRVGRSIHERRSFQGQDNDAWDGAVPEIAEGRGKKSKGEIQLPVV